MTSATGKPHEMQTGPLTGRPRKRWERSFAEADAWSLQLLGPLTGGLRGRPQTPRDRQRASSLPHPTPSPEEAAPGPTENTLAFAYFDVEGFQEKEISIRPGSF